MQYINDDMDELFRRAAEDYALNTNSADWNAVVKKLSAKTAGLTNDDKHRNKKYKRLLLLLLLVPLGWLGNYFYQHDGGHAVNSQDGANPNTTDVSKNGSLSPLPGTSTLNNSSSSSTVATVTLRDDRSTSASIQLTDQNNNPYHKKGAVHIDVFTPMVNNADASDKTNSTTVINSDSKQLSSNKEEIIPELKNDDENNTIQQEADKKESGKTVSTNKNKKQKANGIYVGVMISPDISTIKFQDVKNIGLTEGFIIGYQINKSIAVETGMAWNKKYYHSDGKYFNAKNITLASNTEIKKLDGTCEMIEVPVTVRYNFKALPKASLSVSAGMSSYIMKRENYTYTIEHSGVQYPRNAGYKNSSTDMFAVANVGFAYNRNLGKKTVLRLEPYVKIPVKGVGIGDLPIMSTGINIAVTKKLFK